MAKVHVQLKIRPVGELSEVDDSEIPGLISSGFLDPDAQPDKKTAAKVAAATTTPAAGGTGTTTEGN